MSFNPIEVVRKHIELKEQYERSLTDESKEKAVRDPHSRRKPRYCGLTVHFAIGGCPFRCSYCYIYDMGFRHTASPYPLDPKELAYALLSNRNFMSGKHGTLIAVGSITEPFLFEEKTLEFLRELSRLGNPIQFSTKKYIGKTLANALANISSRLSPLITIVTFELSNILEPYAPSPDKRLETIRNLRESGLKPCLFLRPIIIGINYDEAFEVMKAAKENGAVGVVIGSFRITYNIYLKFKDLGLDTDPILRRIDPKKLRKNPGKQYTVALRRKEKLELVNFARKIGLIPFLSACCANSYISSVICPSICFETSFCTRCPNNCMDKERPRTNLVVSALDMLNIRLDLVEKEGKILLRNGDYAPLVQVLSRRLTLPRRL